MINILELVEIEEKNGYSLDYANAKVCQDIILYALANGPLSHHVTVKGGVVMRSKSKNIRRATLDLDIDFIRYSLSDESLNAFVDNLNCIQGIEIMRVGRIKKLKQQDYHGKRIFVEIRDMQGNMIDTKLDIGVHKRLEIDQEEYCFDITLDENGVKLLVNSSEQMFAEKLRSLLKFGPGSTRYKDIIDRVTMTFNDSLYLENISTTNKRWIDGDIKDIFMKIELFLLSMKNMMIML